MIIDLIRLNNNIDKEIKLSNKVEIEKEKLNSVKLIDLDANINGVIIKTKLDYYFNFDINGVMIVPCSITLKPVNHSFNIKIEGNLSEILEEIDKNVKIDENTLDIFPIIWENILVEIPMKVVSKEAKLENIKGDGWEFITEKNKETEINPEFEKLKDLL